MLSDNLFVEIAVAWLISLFFMFPVHFSVSLSCDNLRFFQCVLFETSNKNFIVFNFWLFCYLIQGFFNTAFVSWQGVFVIIMVIINKSVSQDFSEFLNIFWIPDDYHTFCSCIVLFFVLLNLVRNLFEWHDNSIIPCLKRCGYSVKDFISQSHYPFKGFSNRKYAARNKASQLGFVKGVGWAAFLVLPLGLLCIYYFLS